MELINTHCHSKYCGHGQGEIAQYAAQAAAAGLTTLAFTEHYPLSPAFDPQEYLSVLPERMPEYHAAVEEARAAYPQMEILLGVELDCLSDTEDRTFDQAEFDKYDLVLGSVHFVDRWAFDDPAERHVWQRAGEPDRIWRRYIELWCEAASDSHAPYTVMSHPDLAKKFSYMPTFPLDSAYAQMAEAARAGGKMVEVNTSGSYYACAEMFPAPALLKAFCQAGVPCTVGTDAHDPKNVARDITRAYDLMRACGYTEVTVPGRGGNLRTIALES
jgi:histidinol-phosphatase (PHP family)